MIRQTRRRFLYSSTLAAMGAPAILKCAEPSKKLNVAFIGTGGKGASNIEGLASENITALCDVDPGALSKALAKYPGAKGYKDFRKMLEQKDIDAVVITTPDHCHAVAAIAAMKLGKHVYCEKPLTHSIWEAREMQRIAREKRVATQMGNSGHAGESPRIVKEWVAAGVIGAVKEVHSWSNRPIWPQGIERPADSPPIPQGLDWDLWIGPAPMRAYHPAYHPFKWRGWCDFGTGALGDMGCHIIDAPYWALDLAGDAIVEAEAEGMTDETYPKASVVRYQIPAKGNRKALQLTWYDGGKQPSRELTELAEGEVLGLNGNLLIGEKGKILVDQGRTPPRLMPAAAMKDFQPPPKSLPRSIGHYKEWIEACKGGEPAGSNFDHAAPLTELVLLGNVALRAGKKIDWDSKQMRVRNDRAATAFIRREYRKGWEI